MLRGEFKAFFNSTEPEWRQKISPIQKPWCISENAAVMQHEQLLWSPRDNETLWKPNAVQSDFRQNDLTYFSKLKKKKKKMNWQYFCTKIFTISKNYPPHSSFSHIGVLYLNWKLQDPSHCLNYFPNLTWNHIPLWSLAESLLLYSNFYSTSVILLYSNS